MPSPNLDSTQFQNALTAANIHFSQIQQRYPSLNGYLVLFLKGAQTRIDAPLPEMIAEFPALLIEGASKSGMIALMAAPLSEDSSTRQKDERAERLQHLAQTLEFDGNVQVEIRFHQLDYSLIWKLQADALVDRELTPQTKASIRIVLGLLAAFESV